MRLVLPLWLALVATLLLFLPLVTLCQASTVKHFTAGESTPITTATATATETGASKASFQISSTLSLSIRTDRAIYLAGETIAISVNTNQLSTWVRLRAQLPNGDLITIGEFATSGNYMKSWSAPPTSGQVKLFCDGEATVQALVWTECCETIGSPGETPRIYCYPCQRIVTQTVTSTASCDVRIFDRITFLSGHITDNNQRPVPGAIVYLATTRQSASANGDGFYQFPSYELSNNYTLVDQIPTVTETVSVRAVACEPQPDKIVQVQAERGASGVNFILKRSFYPAAIELAYFTLDAFSSWSEAGQYSTWQNILGITIASQAKVRKLSFGTKELPPLSFDIGDKKLLLVTKPDTGRYFLELEGRPKTPFTVGAAATLNNQYLGQQVINGMIEGKGTQRLRLMLSREGIELKIIKPPNMLLLIIPAIIGFIGVILAAFFVTGGQLGSLKKAFAGFKTARSKLPKAEELTEGKTQVLVKKTKSKRTRTKKVSRGKGKQVEKNRREQ